MKESLEGETHGTKASGVPANLSHSLHAGFTTEQLQWEERQTASPFADEIN